jgi:hypothetical protein
MNCCRETVEMAVILCNRRELDPRRTRAVRRRVRHPRTPGFRLVEPTARREGRSGTRSQQATREISEFNTRGESIWIEKSSLKFVSDWGNLKKKYPHAR